MRRLLPLLLLLCAVPARADYARVQTPAGQTAAGGFTTTLTATSAGESIRFMGFFATATTLTVSDSSLDTCVVDVKVGTSPGVFVGSCCNTTAGTTSGTITASGGSIVVGWVVTYSGGLTSGCFDQSAGQNNPTSTTYTTLATATLAATNDLALGIVGTGNSASASLAASGAWSNITAHLANGGDGDDARPQEILSTGSTTGVAATGTCTSLASMWAGIATYKAASGAAASPKRTLAGVGT